MQKWVCSTLLGLFSDENPFSAKKMGEGLRFSTLKKLVGSVIFNSTICKNGCALLFSKRKTFSALKKWREGLRFSALKKLVGSAIFKCTIRKNGCGLPFSALKAFSTLKNGRGSVLFSATKNEPVFKYLFNAKKMGGGCAFQR